MKSLNIFYFGWTSQAARPLLLSAPKAPRNYGPEAAARYVEKAWEDANQEAGGYPIVGTLSEVVIYDGEGTVYHCKNDKPGEVGCQLVNWLNENFPNLIGDNLVVTPRRGSYHEAVHGGQPILLGFGLDIHTMLEIAGLEALAQGIPTPIRLWHSPLGFYDPVQILIPGADLRKKVSLASLMQFLFKEQATENALRSVLEDVHGQAKLVRDLVRKGQLLGPV